MTKEALTLALEALELAGGNLCEALHHPKKLQHGIGEPCPAVAKYDQAITAIKEALAQPEQEKERCVGCEACIDTACGRDECPKGWPKAAQPEQEPVAWMRDDGMKAMVADEKRAWIECGRGQLVDDYNKPLYKIPWEDDGVPYTVVECNCSGKTTLFSPPQPLKEPTDSMVLTLMGNSFLGKEDARDALQDILQETHLYTTPPPVPEAHKLKPLTIDQIASIAIDRSKPDGIIAFVRAIEAAHGIKE